MLSPQDKSRIAANNNADLCATIMTAHGIRTERDDIAYRCIDDPLPYYPKVVTLNPTAVHELNSRCIGARSVKDSFSCLDADALGLRVAFDASWLWCETERQDMPDKWIRIKKTSTLLDWHKAWRDDGSPTDQVIFSPECLENPNLAFFARLSGTMIEAGCIANFSNDVVGMSNVFTSIPNDQKLYKEALAAVSNVSDGRPVVGYEHGGDLDAACSAGFGVVGPLRVLIR